MAPMRQGIAAVTACVALCAAPAGRADHAWPRARERAGSRADDDQVHRAARRAHARALDRRARRGAATSGSIPSASARASRASSKPTAAPRGGARAWRRAASARRPTAPRSTERIRRDGLVASITRHAHGERAWSRAFADLNRRWRAATQSRPAPPPRAGAVRTCPSAATGAAGSPSPTSATSPRNGSRASTWSACCNRARQGARLRPRRRRRRGRHAPLPAAPLGLPCASACRFDDDSTRSSSRPAPRADLEVALRAVARLSGCVDCEGPAGGRDPVVVRRDRLGQSCGQAIEERAPSSWRRTALRVPTTLWRTPTGRSCRERRLLGHG